MTDYYFIFINNIRHLLIISSIQFRVSCTWENLSWMSRKSHRGMFVARVRVLLQEGNQSRGGLRRFFWLEEDHTHVSCCSPIKILNFAHPYIAYVNLQESCRWRSAVNDWQCPEISKHSSSSSSQLVSGSVWENQLQQIFVLHPRTTRCCRTR